jgi:hypothetical protein
MRVRSTRDANVIFHAVNLGILPMVMRRLDAADRAALRPGCVYVWEERAPSSDATGVGMERFTEGRHWHPSRVRDVSLTPLSQNCINFSKFILTCFVGLPAISREGL